MTPAFHHAIEERLPHPQEFETLAQDKADALEGVLMAPVRPTKDEMSCVGSVVAFFYNCGVIGDPCTYTHVDMVKVCKDFAYGSDVMEVA